MPTWARDMLKIGALLAVAAGMGACASSSSEMLIERDRESPGNTVGALGGKASDLKGDASELEGLAAEIERLSQSYREEFGVEGDGGGQEQPPSEPVDRSCPRVCEVAEAICSSSSRICAISGRFPEEGHFTERCGWSEGQCAEARNRCETCQP